MHAFAISVFSIAALSCLLFACNLPLYRLPRRRHPTNTSRISILIPARDEERSIESTVRAALATEAVEFEVVVADDHSRDRTAAIVSEIAREDPRVRLITVPFLPSGWCGKQFTCQTLSEAARFEFLCFLDADVQLEPLGISALVGTLLESKVDLLSGFPKQEVVSLLERMLIPLMHFLLLGYLPMLGMKKTRNPAYAAGCGQLFLARADAYRHAGGHASIKASRHDGLTLPKAFRRAGLATDMCDATSVARCRMYRSNGEVLRGLLKNATEGLASPGRILPFSLLLLWGQVFPIVLFASLLVHKSNRQDLLLSGVAVVLCYLPRAIAVVKFEQPVSGALLHPVSIALLLGLQWYAFILSLAGVPSMWKGRNYSTT